MDKLLVSIAVDDIFGGLFITVQPGYVGCVYSHGRGVLLKVMNPGIHLKIPFWHKAKLFNVQTQQYTIRKGFDASKSDFGDDALEVITKDSVKMRVEMTILYHINPDNATTLWQNVGDNYVEKIIRPVTRSRIPRVFSRYNSAQVSTDLQVNIEEEVEKELADIFSGKGIVVENVLMSSVA